VGMQTGMASTLSIFVEGIVMMKIPQFIQMLRKFLKMASIKIVIRLI